MEEKMLVRTQMMFKSTNEVTKLHSFKINIEPNQTTCELLEHPGKKRRSTRKKNIVKMPAGRYWIGDFYPVMPEKDLPEFEQLVFNHVDNSEAGHPFKFRFKAKDVCMIDMFAIYPVSEAFVSDDESDGYFHEFSEPFEVHFDSSVLTCGETLVVCFVG